MKKETPPPIRRKRSIIYNGYPGEAVLVERRPSEERELSPTRQELDSSDNITITKERFKRPSFLANYLRSSPEGEDSKTSCQSISEDAIETRGEKRERTNNEELLKRYFGDLENRLFEVFGDKSARTINVFKFFSGLLETGLRLKDPRLREMVEGLRKIQENFSPTEERSLQVNYDAFLGIISQNLEIVVKAFSNSFIIPDFLGFAHHIDELYYECKSNNSGMVATYIPQLSRFDPSNWGVSLCSVDGQRHSIGDVNLPFTLQSCSKPMNYAIAAGESSPSYVHSFIGMEPSGRYFNELCLDHNSKSVWLTFSFKTAQSELRRDIVMALFLTRGNNFSVFEKVSYAVNYALGITDVGEKEMHGSMGMEPSGRYNDEICLDEKNKPHNPMINAGAIMTASLIKPELSSADRFDYVFNQYRRICGNEYLGFNNAVFLSERECADRNFALAYFMRENKCFPPGTKITDVLDFYFQLCSLEITAESGAVIAATLANGGINPITGEAILSVEAVRNTLTLMHSCGMYNYSGQFAFQVGLPAKSGVSGCILLVVPNTLGICLWSPALDANGNSCRGVQFCMELVTRFKFHHFDNLRGRICNKIDPRIGKNESKAQVLFDLLFSVAAGDISSLKRHAMTGTNLNACDYDGRTALHVAASEGHDDIVEFLLDKCLVTPDLKDRWGRTPLDDARHFNHALCTSLIEKHLHLRTVEHPNLQPTLSFTQPTPEPNDLINSPFLVDTCNSRRLLQKQESLPESSPASEKSFLSLPDQESPGLLLSPDEPSIVSSLSHEFSNKLSTISN